MWFPWLQKEHTTTHNDNTDNYNNNDALQAVGSSIIIGHQYVLAFAALVVSDVGHNHNHNGAS